MTKENETTNEDEISDSSSVFAKDSNDISNKDSPSVEENSQNILKEKLEAFHKRIGYSYFWPELAAQTNAEDNQPSSDNLKSAEKPENVSVESPKKKSPVMSKTNCPETTKNDQSPLETVEKPVNDCISSTPKTKFAVKPKVTASTSINFASDSIFASVEFSNFFSDLNISIGAFSSPTSNH